MATGTLYTGKRRPNFELNYRAPVPGLGHNLKAAMKGLTAFRYPKSETGLYFSGDRPQSFVIGLRRTTDYRSPGVKINTASSLSQVETLIRSEEPFNYFILDAGYEDTLSWLESIVQVTGGNEKYSGRCPIVSLVVRGREELLPYVKEKYARAPVHFVPAKKYGADVIDANLLGQPRQ